MVSLAEAGSNRKVTHPSSNFNWDLHSLSLQSTPTSFNCQCLPLPPTLSLYISLPETIPCSPSYLISLLSVDLEREERAYISISQSLSNFTRDISQSTDCMWPSLDLYIYFSSVYIIIYVVVGENGCRVLGCSSTFTSV